jgi:hypothetical protein
MKVDQTLLKMERIRDHIKLEQSLHDEAEDWIENLAGFLLKIPLLT